MNNLGEVPQTLSAAAEYGIEVLARRLAGLKLLALTGAGISTDSGIPDYRGAGRVARHPMTFDSFMGSTEAQTRYWARSYVGWSRIAMAKPNAGHFALASAELRGSIDAVITQNVDGLHQAAGTRNIEELHGRLDRVICMQCGQVEPRTRIDERLAEHNPGVAKSQEIEFTPDGDAEVAVEAGFRIPSCLNCGGVLKPDVVFFGEQVPPERVERCFALLAEAEALLVAGTSLAVNSGLRFARQAAKTGKPVFIVNWGPTKADELASAKIEGNTSLVLERLFS